MDHKTESALLEKRLLDCSDAVEAEVAKFPDRIMPLIDALLAASMDAMKHEAIAAAAALEREAAEVRGATWAKLSEWEIAEDHEAYTHWLVEAGVQAARICAERRGK